MGGAVFLLELTPNDAVMADLEAAKRRLSDVLRDNIQKYWDLMKSWYRRKVIIFDRWLSYLLPHKLHRYFTHGSAY